MYVCALCPVYVYMYIIHFIENWDDGYFLLVHGCMWMFKLFNFPFLILSSQSQYRPSLAFLFIFILFNLQAYFFFLIFFITTKSLLYPKSSSPPILLITGVELLISCYEPPRQAPQGTYKHTHQMKFVYYTAFIC